MRGGFSPTRITIGIPLSDRESGCSNGILARAYDPVVFPERGQLYYLLPADTAWSTVQLERESLVAAGVPEPSIERMSVISPQAGQHSRLVRLVRSALDGDVSSDEQRGFRDALLGELYQAMDEDNRRLLGERPWSIVGS